MQLLNAAIQVVPLHDSKLSRCRSNIGWIEGTVFGSAIFGPNFYSWLGCDKSYFYNHLNDFVDNFEELIELSSDHRSYANLISESKILKNFNLKIINKQRIDIVRGLAKWDTMKKRRQ